MADDLNVDLQVGSNELEANLVRMAAVMQQMYQTATGVQSAFEHTAAAIRLLPEHVRKTREEQARMAAGGDMVGAFKLESQIKSSVENQRQFNTELNETSRLHKEINLARNEGQRQASQTRVPDGRTVEQVRQTERALADTITGINTTADQITARLALATGKAMERMVTSTMRAVEESVRAAEVRVNARSARMSVPGVDAAEVINARVRGERAVELAASGQTLAERRQRADRIAAENERAAQRTREETATRAQIEGYRANEIRQGLAADQRNLDPRTALREESQNRSFSRRYGIGYDQYSQMTQGMNTAERRAFLSEYEQKLTASTAGGTDKARAEAIVQAGMKQVQEIQRKTAENFERLTQSYRNQDLAAQQRADFSNYDPAAALRARGLNQRFTKSYGVSYAQYETDTAGMDRAGKLGYLDNRQTQVALAAAAKKAADATKKALDDEAKAAEEKIAQQTRTSQEVEARNRVLEMNRDRRSAERENRERDAAAREAALGTYRQAGAENKEFDARERAAALRMRAQAEWDNRKFDRGVKEDQRDAKNDAIREYNQAQEENRLRNLERNRVRRAAERENVERDAAERLRRNPDAALRDVRRDEAFLKNTGINRADWEQRIARENLTGPQQRSILNEARAGIRSQAEAARGTPEERMQAGVERTIASRNALMNYNGGADMLTFQAQLSANYAILGLFTGAITGASKAIIDFDENLIKFQAITSTTNSEMTSFKENLLAVAAGSKFSVNELTQVAIALGQTGLSALDVTKALKPVVDLAAASGATLQQSVEAITATLGAFNMEAGRAGDVADVFVAALNRTKLTMDQLQLGIQYAANIARDSGVSFSELTASIGAIAQAGVKSGSTIGTGLRQLITELSSPTDKLRSVLKELGISLNDVDLRTQGFTGVLETLRAKGFGTSEALRSLDLRAAAAFSALSGQAEKVKLLEQEFLLTSAASEGAAKANESFSASGQRLTNVVFAMVDKGFSPLISALGKAIGGTADLLAHFNDLGPTLPIIATGLATIAASAAAIRIGGLLAGLGGLAGGAGLAALTGPVGVGALAIGATGGVLYYLSQLQTEAQKARERLDELKGVENELTSRQSRIQVASTDIDNRIQTLIDRSDRLNADPILRRNAIIDAQKAFGDLGLAVDGSSSNIETLITALQKLRGQLSQEMPQLLSQQLASVNEQILQLIKLQDQQSNSQRDTGARTVMTMGPDGNMVTSVVRTGASRRYDSLGAPFQEAGRYLRGEARLDPNDAYGSSAGVRYPMGAEVLRMTQERLELQSQEPSRARDQALQNLKVRLDLATEALKLFDEKVKATADLQGQNVKVETLMRTQAAEAIRSRPEFQELARRREELSANENRAVLNASTQPGMAGFEAMNQGLRTSDAAASQALTQIEKAKFEDIFYKKIDPAAVAEAYAPLIDKYNGLLKGISNETRQRFEDVKPTAVNQLNQGIRTSEAQLALIQRQAAASNSVERVAEYEELAKSIQKEISAYRAQLFRLGVGPDADRRIEVDPQLAGQKAELQEADRVALERLTLSYADLRRRAQEQMLTFQSGAEGSRKALIEEQIKGLEKVRDDVRTTPERMKEVVEQINALLKQAAEAARNVISLNTQKAEMTLPQAGSEGIRPAMTAAPGTVKAEILDGLKARGRADLIDYAMGTAQRESSFNPNAVSPANAKGVFQFKDKTWADNGGGNVYSVQDQIKNFITLVDKDKKAFRDAFGYDPSPGELYLLHQQGEAGGKALLRNPTMNAVDALTPAYKGNRAIALSAVVGNGGTADMTAGEFAESRMRQFRTSLAAAGRFNTRTERQVLKDSETDQKDRVSEDLANDRRKNEQAAAAATRATNLAALRKTDRELTSTYETQLLLAKRVQDPAAVLDANKKAYDTLGQLFKVAQGQDENRPDRQNDEDMARTRASTRERFGNLYSQQGLTQAEVAGRAVEKRYADELRQAKDRRDELLRPDNVGREGNTELLNTLNAQIETLERRNELEGKYEANQAKIVALEENLKAMKEAGLEGSKATLDVESRIKDLKEDSKRMEGTRNFARTQAGTQKTYGEAVAGAVDSFEKSRGIRNFKGEVVDPITEARGILEENLKSIGNAFDNLFTNLATGSMTAGEALKKFATDILGNVMSSISKSLTNDIMKSLFNTGGPGGSSGSAGGGILDGIMSIFGKGMALGGPVRMAGGGPVRMAGGGAVNRDSVPILAMPGEYMLRKSAVDAIGVDKLDQVNNLGNAMVSRAPKVDASQKFGGSRSEANVYVVDRDQVPPPSESDIVHIIGGDIQRGGAIRQLIKRVASGG